MSRPLKPGVLAFVTNDAWYFVSHRLQIAERAIAAGYEVHVIAREDAMAERVREAGCHFHPWSIEPRGNSLLSEWRAIRHLRTILTTIRPDVLHLITIKPVLYGGLLASWFKVPAVVYAIAGLGAVFSGTGARAVVLRRLVLPLYGRALAHPNATLIFQNAADRDVILGLFPGLSATVILIRGSGVDLARFKWVPEPVDGPFVVTLAARLLRDKGVAEFVAAADLVASRLGAEAIRFQIAGGFAGAGNPAAMSAAEIARLAASSSVVFLGECDDVAALYAASHVACLPSWREGLPKALVEAAAAGRAVVTTDVPGCRDAIEPERTGILVPVRDAPALADAILALAGDPERRHLMGEAGRKLAEREFDVHKVAERHLEIYAALATARVRDVR